MAVFVVFSTAAPLVTSDANEIDDDYLRATIDNITILVSTKHGRLGNNHSFEPTMSADGRYTAWTTLATNLTRDTNGIALDVVVKDMYTDKIQAVSIGSDDKQAKNTASRR